MLGKPATIKGFSTSTFSFTAEEAGDYCFLFDEEYIMKDFFSGDYTYMTWERQAMYFGMEAGMTVNFRRENIDSTTATVQVEKCVPMEDVSIVRVNEEIFTGEIVFAGIEFTPRNSRREEYTWTSSDPDVLQETGYGTFLAIAEGDSTITVTTASGKTASVMVHVSPSKTIYLGEIATVASGEKTSFTFTAEYSGEYSFLVDENGCYSLAVSGAC